MGSKEKVIKLKKKLTGALEMPGEVILNLPLITIVGSEEISIENFKGIIEYSDERIRINTTSGVLRVNGRNLVLKQITAENILIKGEMRQLEYIT